MRALPSLGDYGAVPDSDTAALLGALIRNQPLDDAARRLLDVAASPGVERGLVRLLPLLRDHRDWASLPAQIRGRVEVERRQARFRHVMLLRSAGQLAEALNAAGVVPLFLKGFALASTVYVSPADRPMADLDVAVPPADFATAAAILAKLGFEEKIDRAMALGPGRHAATFKDSTGARIVDLHQHVLSFSRWPGADDGFWRRAVGFRLEQARALTLSPEDHLLHAALHGYAHHAAQTPFRWIVDACRILDRAGDHYRWAVLAEEVRRQRCEGVMAAALDFLRTSFAARIPASVIDELAQAPPRPNDDAYFRLHGHLVTPSLSLRWRAFWASYRRHGGDAQPGPLGLLRWASRRWQTSSLGGTLIESLRRLPPAESDRRKQRQGSDAASETRRLREALALKRKP